MPSSPAMAVVTHTAALCVGAAAVTLLLHHRHDAPSPNTDGSTAAKKTNQTSHFNHLLPKLPYSISQPNDNLLIAFDTRNRNPTFVVERINSKQDGGAATKEASSRKNKRFHEDKTIPAHHRSRNHHYRNSGYDRGHLAPAADFKTDSEVHDSFSLSNVSPQLPKFNRTMWLRVEEFVRNVAEHEENSSDDSSDVETWVITGPLWLPSSRLGKDKFRYSYEAIGHPPSLIHVPTHFFKIIVVVSQTAQNKSENPFQLKKFAAFVIPHSEPDKNNNSRLRLVDCMVRLTDLEAVTGLEFFPSLLGSHGDGSDDDNIPPYKELADALTDDVSVHAKNNQLLLEDDNIADVLSQGGVEISKRRQKKIKQLIRDQSPPLFQHLCKKNNACFKFL